MYALQSNRADDTGGSIEPLRYPHLGVPPELILESEVIALLSVSPIQHDHDTLASLLGHDHWRIHNALSLQSASAFLRAHGVPLVICEHELSPGTWTELLNKIRLLAIPPFLIVTSRIADDYLWAEALNLGAYDVLAKPFDLAELARILSSAWQHWHDQQEAPIQSPTTVSAQDTSYYE
ncbi:MAG: response regulator [Acidobacteriia bacterium]|nr:response regulator [Terriglobia bacterium]